MVKIANQLTDSNITINTQLHHFHKHRFYHVNESLMLLMNPDLTEVYNILDSVVDTKRNYAVVRDVRVIRKVQQVLFDISYELSDVYGWPALLTIPYSCLKLIYNTYRFTSMLISSVSSTTVTPALITFHASQIVQDMFPLIILTCCGTRIIEEAKRTGNIVHNVMASYPIYKTLINYELKQFSIEVIERKISFTACGIFAIDNGLFQSIVISSAFIADDKLYILVMCAKKNLITCLRIIDKDVAKQFASMIVNDLVKKTSFILEINPGNGYLTDELLESKVPHIHSYEKEPKYTESLMLLNEKYPDRLSIRPYNLLTLPMIEYKDRVAKSKIMDDIFQGALKNTILPSMSMIFDESAEKIIHHKPNTMFLRTLFDYKMLGSLPRHAFSPEPPDRIDKKRNRKYYTEDTEKMNVVKLIPKSDFFNDHFTRRDAEMFYHFLSIHLRRADIRIIPTFEKWIPDCGPRLIKLNFNIFTEFSELSATELLNLFKIFRSWPEYKTSVFLDIDIYFPDEKLQPSRRNTSIKVSIKCPPNMTLEADSDGNSCECVVGYLYYAPLDSCFKPYMKGPCMSGHYLTLPYNGTVAECRENPCDDGSVIFNGTCNALLKPGLPCSEGQALVINEENFEIECQQIKTVVYQIIVAPIKGCMPGTRKIARGQCRRIL
ncbi:hypothetical protein PV325_002512 [Microctonus aethiopoides]|nr:hypothetical protein PV325_002512 [Microctonus aethiopoides]